MPCKAERTLIRSGTSSVVVLPADYIRGTGLKPGDPVTIAYDSVIILKPRNVRLDLQLLRSELELLIRTIGVEDE